MDQEFWTVVRRGNLEKAAKLKNDAGQTCKMRLRPGLIAETEEGMDGATSRYDEKVSPGFETRPGLFGNMNHNTVTVAKYDIGTKSSARDDSIDGGEEWKRYVGDDPGK